MSDQPVRLQVTALSKRYGKRQVLDSVDLSLSQGSVVAVTGPNGAGKSTLLGCISGALRHSGDVLLDGLPIAGAGPRISYLPQRVRLPGTARGELVIELFRALVGGQADRVTPPPEFVPPLDKPVGQLSGGQAQRLALVAALMGSPDVILLDEPLANLDEAARDVALEMIRAHADAGALVLLASPTLLDLLGAVDSVLHVEGGGITFSGSPDRYLGALPMAIWIRRNGYAPGTFEELADALRVRHVASWTAVECHQDRAAHVLHQLAEKGVDPDHVVLADRASTRGPSSGPPERDR
jgi:ABC-2 type transport system ATP-binding protein